MTNNIQPTAKQKHGMCGTRFYRAWMNMKNRCLTKSHNGYKWYGGNGVGVCDRWLLFVNFRNDMYESYLEHEKLHGERNTTLDRIDGSKEYSPENCRWSTYKKQMRNTSRNVTYKGETAVDASVRLGGECTLIFNRLKRGWTLEDAFTKPLMRTFV